LQWCCAVTHIQALRLDDCAARGLTNCSLVSIASMGDRLRQLALVGLQRVSDEGLMAALTQLPMLQVSNLQTRVLLVGECHPHTVILEHKIQWAV
jgi:hypothetical protein